MALCNAAHLANLKLFDARVAEFALAQPGSGLRGVSTQEVLAADRKLWQAITDLLAKKWILDDALNDIPRLLQPRPASAMTRAAPDSRPAKRPRYEEPPRSKGKLKGKGKGAPPGKGTSTNTPNPNWVESHPGKPICRRYQVAICTAAKCKFLHVCAMKGCQEAIPPRTTLPAGPETARPLTRRRGQGQPSLRTPFPRQQGTQRLLTSTPTSRSHRWSPDFSRCLRRQTLPMLAGCSASRGGPLRPLWLNSACDILNDEGFHSLLGLAWSGLVGLIMLAPPCKEFSRLKLRAGGPKALRTPTGFQASPPRSRPKSMKALPFINAPGPSLKPCLAEAALLSSSNRHLPRAGCSPASNTFYKPVMDT